jgi:hypothetical protein
LAFSFAICGFLDTDEIRRSENVAVPSLGSGGLDYAVGERIANHLSKEMRIDISSSRPPLLPEA